MSSILNKLLSVLTTRRREYMVVARDFKILEASLGVQRFADSEAFATNAPYSAKATLGACPKDVMKGKDVRVAFPELFGLEDIIIDILEGRQINFELPGIGRFLPDGNSLYFDLCIIKSQDESPHGNRLIILFEDVTERMVLEQNLVQAANEKSLLLSTIEASKAYIEKIFTSMADALLVTTPLGIIKTINQATQDLFGYSEEELIGKPISLILGEEKLLPEASQTHLLLNEALKNVEVVCQTKTGEKVAIAFSCSAIDTDIADLQNFIYIGRDITERQRAQKRLAAQYATTRILSESATLREIPLKILQAICENLGWELGELWTPEKGRQGGFSNNPNESFDTSLSSLFPQSPIPNPQLRCVDIWVQPSVDVQEYTTVTWQTTLATGEGLPGRIWANCYPDWIPNVANDANFVRSEVASQVGLHGAFGFPIQGDSELLGVMTFYSREVQRLDEDLLKTMAAIGNQLGQFIKKKQAEAALAQSEERYRDLFENASDLIQSCALNGQFVYVNKAWRETLGYSEAQVEQMNLFDVIHPDCKGEWLEIFSRVMFGEKLDRVTAAFISKDGEKISVEGNINCRFVAGKPVATRAIFRDITERLQTEEALRHQQEQTERLLLNILPEPIADQLKQQTSTIAENFAEVSVRANLKQITAAAKLQDTILFYFSGHGILDLSSQQAVLCLTDTDTDHLLDTGLPLQDVLQLLGNSCAHQQLVWLDACHSGGMSLVGARPPTAGEPVLNPTPQLVEVLQQRAQKSKGFYALVSCDQGQQSWEFPELGHGVFTYYLMRGLHGEAADSQGVIEADGLYRYVYHQTLQYIDKTNQQLRLINQQRLSRGETLLYPEYPLQTPKRIVEGVGELILGRRPDKGVESKHSRVALVVEGLSGSQITLALSKMLNSAGRFELEYWPRPGKAASSDVREAIAHRVAPEAIALRLEPQNLPQAEPATVLLYLRGRIEETEAGELELVLGEDIRLSRSWLRQQLRRSSIAQQIIILDCPVGTKRPSPPLLDWVEDLQLGLERGQCLIAAASPATEPERFTQALLDTLMAGNQPTGLSVAGWITQLQVYLAGSGIPLHVWLSGAQGVIEILPGKNGSRGVELTEEFDLGLCPYMGLSAFKEEDAQYFYGRESLTQQLINQLLHRSCLAVVGASGSGKSSVVQAGLIAQLRQGKQLPSSEQWWVKSFRPGVHPLEALAQRLVDTGTEKEKAKQQLQIEGMLHQGIEGFVYWIRSRPEPIVVLVVDQFEELFTLAPTEDRERFLKLVLGAVEYAQDRFKLVITLRSDFIASCLEVPELAKALQQSSVLVPPRLSEDDYRRVIVKPAEQVGLKVEPELVEVLLQELSQSVGDLPVLEFVLEQLWEQRSHGELTLQAYQQQLGGVKGALQRSCQAVYEALDPQAQDCAKWIFLSLTQLGEGTEDTRRRVLKSELIVKKYPTALVERTLQALTAAKLVVMNLEEDGSAVGTSREAPSTPLESEELMLEAMKQEVNVEVAHEVLIRHWSTLRWWLEENRARLRSHRQIRQAAMLWKQSGEQSDFLLQGVRLAEAEDIYIKYTDELSEDVQRFIEACLEERQRQQLQEKRRLRQAQRAVVITSVLGLAALGFGGLAYQQSQMAQLREIEALNSLSENFLLANQQLEALVTSVKAGKELQRMRGLSKAIPPGIPVAIATQTAHTLQQAIDGTQEQNRLIGHSSWVTNVRFSPDGQTIASASADATFKIWSRDGTLLKTIQGHTDGVNDLSFSSDGQIIASASTDKTIKLWRRDGTLLKTLQGHRASVSTVSFSPDGQTIASASDDKTIKLWRRDGTLLKTLPGHKGGINSVRFSPDGQTFVSTGDEGTIKLWSKDGQLLRTLQGHTNEVAGATFSPNGHKIASASADGTIKLWSVKSGQLLLTLRGHTAGVEGVSFSPNGSIIASGSGDKTIKLWSADSGSLLKTFAEHKGSVGSVSFSPDGHTLASGSDDGTIKLWSSDVSLPKVLRGHSSDVIGVSFSPDGKMLASASGDRTIRLWSRDRKLLKILSGHRAEVTSAKFSPDGQMLASASGDRTIKLWNRDGTLLKTLTGHHSWVMGISFSPDGQILASASADGTIKLWSRDGTLLKTLTGHRSWVASVSFSPDSQMLASASADGTVKLWSRNGTLLKTLTGHRASVWGVSFSPDGKMLASASQDTTVNLWSITGTLLRTFRGHSHEVNSLSFSPDGKMLASGSDDHTIKLWSVSSGTLLKTFQGHSGNVRSVSFSPDGKTLASASQDTTVNLWSLDGIKVQTINLDALLLRGCNKLHDYLKTNSEVSKEEGQLCSGS